MGVIRTATLQDAPAIADIYAPYVAHTAISFEAAPPTVDEMAARISTVLRTYPWLVWEEGGKVAAYAYASRHAERAAYRWAVDVAVYAAQDSRGRGAGRALHSALFPILERQGLHTAWAGIALPNAASVGLHEAMGFRHIGTFEGIGFKLGAWHGVGWWRRELRPGQPAGEPIPFPELPA